MLGYCGNRDEPTLTVIEGYAMGTQRQAHSYAIGELGGLVRWHLWTQEKPYVEIPPATLKKFATGKGNAPKDAMLAAAIRKFGFEGSDNNEADAWLLRCMGLSHLDTWGYAKSTYSIEALAKVAWPDV